MPTPKQSKKKIVKYWAELNEKGDIDIDYIWEIEKEAKRYSKLNPYFPGKYIPCEIHYNLPAKKK